MRFPPAFLDELRMRTRISEVVSRKVKLKSQGRGEHTGLCPFHKEKTPSFTVSDEKHFYHCFGCGVHGDAVGFLIESQGLSFVEAVGQLAAEAGMSIPAPSREEEEKYEKYDRGHELLDAACLFFEEQLKTSSEAKEYINKRGLTDSTVSTFRVGLSPARDNKLKAAMLAKGYSEEELAETGLVVKKDNGDTYDKFRGRLMFPIMDGKGRVVAFGGRILGDGEPKYLNSPETYLFKKGYILYNWHLARQTAYDKRNIAIVEGYMDVIALYQAGIKNVVAPLGTALTEGHIRQIWKVVNEPVLCFDGDNAGKRAMYRAATNYINLLEPGYSIKFATLPEGKDPDDVIKMSGIDKMREILSSSESLSDVLWEFEISKKPTKTPEQKADLQQRLMNLANSIQNKSVQDYYRKYFNNKLWEMGIYTKKKGIKRLTPIDQSIITEETSKERFETMLFKMALNCPEIFDDHEIEHDFMDLHLSSDRYESLREAITHFIAGEYEQNKEKLAEYLENLSLETQINHINTCKFMGSFAKRETPLEVVRSEWRYILSLHNLCSAEEEYKNALNTFQNEVTEEAQTQMLELQKQIDSLKQTIESEKKHREILLDE
jgi:DNA primase